MIGIFKEVGSLRKHEEANCPAFGLREATWGNHT